MKISSPVYLAAANTAPAAAAAKEDSAVSAASAEATEASAAEEPVDSLAGRTLSAALDKDSLMGNMTENIYHKARLPAVASAAGLLGAYAGWKGVAAVGVVGALGAALYAASNSEGREVNLSKVMLAAGSVGAAASGLGAWMGPEKALILAATAVVGSAGYGAVSGAQGFVDSQRAAESEA